MHARPSTLGAWLLLLILATLTALTVTDAHATVASAAACSSTDAYAADTCQPTTTPASSTPPPHTTTTAAAAMSSTPSGSAVVSVSPLGSPWKTRDPFIFCVHHLDKYPAGNAKFGPAASLAGRDIGQDFAGKDGWNMYHGDTVPGFPGHPHRGFETITIVRQGLIDHSDSLGATARFGLGDVQWVTAGAGIVHSEMFPLLNQNGPNTLELFQLWLNLPAKNKMAKPHFTMFWQPDIPLKRYTDAAGKATTVTVIAGALDDAQPLKPPPESWAATADSDLAIWSIRLEAGAKWTLPAARTSVAVRTLHQFVGEGLTVDGRDVKGPAAIEVRPQSAIVLEATRGVVEILMLQARPIKEPVAQRGPFVMNTAAELQQAFRDYQQTQFGGWPFKDDAPVHPKEKGRFAKHADGRIEEPKLSQPTEATSAQK